MIVEGNENNFNEQINDNETVVVDFYATWCGPCKMFLSVLEEFARENNEIKVLKVDVDQAIGIAAYYRVMSVPTIMVFKNGMPIKQVTGFHTKQELENIIK